MFQSTWPLRGGWTLSGAGLTNQTFITQDEHEACQLTKGKKKISYLGLILSSTFCEEHPSRTRVR
jgi:hypothetical protein